MKNLEVLDYLIDNLKRENVKYRDLRIPQEFNDKKNLYRSLVNIRYPVPISAEYIAAEDEYLQRELASKGVIHAMDLPSALYNKIALWQGDITRLDVDVIVNAANSKLLGCFIPCHKCIDNAIHSAAGIKLRQECKKIMDDQGFDEPTGKAKITAGYNLPAKYVIHTVGPIVYDNVSKLERNQLKSCYYECLKLADENKLKSIAFCCISTGEFRFPNELAAEIAMDTIIEYLKNENENLERVVINVFKDEDRKLYEEIIARIK